MPKTLLAPDDQTTLLQKIQTDPQYGRAYLQEVSRQDFTYFCRDVLGYVDMNAQHEALCEFLQYEPAKVRLILMPRYTFKSSIVTIAKTLWRLLCDPNEKLLLYSD